MNNSQQHTAKVSALISKIDSLAGTEQAIQTVLQTCEQRGPVIVSFVNAHAVNMALKNAEFYDALMDADVLLRDGIGIEILMKVMGLSPGYNLNGTDFIAAFLAFYANTAKRVLLLGTQEPYLEQASERIKQMGIDVVATCDGFHNQEQYVDVAERHPCDVIVLGMGMPKQERVAMLLKQTLNNECVIVNGGAIIDFLGGKVSRAPKWVQRISCEWVYRLMLEPKRLWRRYILGGFVFVLHVVQTKMVNYKFKL